MGKTLIIAEKPSVATDLARVLGKLPGMSKFSKEKDYFENGTHVISSAIGHLVELALPEIDGKRLKWNFESLPVMPREFDLLPIEKTKERYNLLRRLIKRTDVTELVNACDAGREGELIFRYVVDSVGTKKPIRRLWMQSMTDGSIKNAFDHLRSDQEMLPLADAARCRSESDWLVGINGTRAMTAYNSRYGGFQLTPVGRVQTPTLTILVKREREIQAFVPRQYFEVFGDFDVKAGNYRGRWFNEAFQKDEANEHGRAERLWELEKAAEIKVRCEGKEGIVEQKVKPTKTGAPLLYDLTTLQREASNRFGFSARRTLQIAQALYEKFKVLTYPRTDSRYLPEDYVETLKGTMSTFAKLSPSNAGDFPVDLIPHAGTLIKQKMIFSNKRIFDGSKVSDHFAIVPTGEIPPRNMGEAERKLFDFVTRRTMAVFFPPAEFEVTTRITRIQADAFKTEGKVLKVPGWLAVYGKEAVGEEGGANLIPAEDGETAQNTAVEVTDNMTKPPPRYNEATLLSGMESAGKLVDDDELRLAMSERGLGTPATRAAIIEGLIFDKYIEREGRDFLVTNKGMALIDQLSLIGADALSQPEMTGQWEYKLKRMESGELTRDHFMTEIRALTEEIVGRARNHAAAAKEERLPDLDAECPNCGTRPLHQTDAKVTCPGPGCKFSVFRRIAGVLLDEDDLKALLKTRFLPPREGFRNRFGKEFSAALELTPDLKVNFVFESAEQKEDRMQALEHAPELGPCPVCASKKLDSPILITDNAYICRRRLADSKSCTVSLGRTLCQVPISEEQARKFFFEGKTDVIANFVSKKGRPFSASLGFNPGGKRQLVWEFPPRAKKGSEAGDDSDGSGAEMPQERHDQGEPGPASSLPRKVPARKVPARKAGAKKVPVKKAAVRKPAARKG